MFPSIVSGVVGETVIVPVPLFLITNNLPAPKEEAEGRFTVKVPLVQSTK